MLFITMLLIGNNNHAQNSSAFKKMEGLNNKVVYCVMQDSRGYIWAGTEAGAARYDGYGFKQFTKDDGLSDNDVFQIKEDSKGRLWFLTYNGDPTVYDHGNILTPKNSSLLTGVKPACMATGFLEKGDTAYYITLKKVYVFVKDSLKTIVATSALGIRNAYHHFFNGFVYNNNMYCLSPMGIHRLNTGSFIPFASNTVTFDAIATKMLFLNNKVVISSNHCVYIFDMVQNKMDRIQLPQSLNTIDIAASKQANIVWVLTDSNVYDLNLEQKECTINKAFQLPALSSLIFDREGNLWAGGLGQGLFCRPNNKVRLFNYTTTAKTQTAYSLAAFNKHLYAGYANGEFVVCNATNKTFVKSYKGGAPSPTKLYDFCSTSDGLWIAAGNRLLEVGDDGNIKLEFLNAAKAVAVDNYNHLYLAYSFSVIRTDIDKLKKLAGKDIRSIAAQVFEGRVNSIFCEGKDSVWLGALSGIQLLVKGKLQPSAFSKQNPFRSSVSKVCSTKYGIAFCTQGEGLVLMNKDSSYILQKANGLVNNSCNSLFASGDTLWVATVSGLSRIVVQAKGKALQFSYKNYTEANGLASNKVNDVKVLNDTVWLATENGVCFFDIREPDIALPAPMVNIEEVLVNGAGKAFSSPLQLNYRENNIHIKFTGISLYSKSAILYQYKLLGADNEWHQTTLREVEYASLAPGKYTFMLMAANADGTWNNVPERIEFEIVPPFWQTWWFKLLMAAIIAGLLFLFVHYRLTQQKQKLFFINKALVLEKEKAEYGKQLVELEQQALRLQMNPHFIFNAITAVQGLYAAGKTYEAKEYLQRFSRMLRSIFEVSALPHIPLSKELELVTDYIELTISKLSYTIHYRIDCTVDANKYAIPPLLLQPFVENALVHGLLPLRKEGHLKLTVRMDGDKMLYTIEDDGKGIDPQQVGGDTRPSGLSVTRQRINLLNHADEKEAAFSIRSVTGNDGSTKGTIVIFTTSIMYAHA